MKSRSISYICRSAILLATLISLFPVATGDTARAAGGWHAYNPLPAPRPPETDVRAGGVLDVSYNYHVQGPASGVAA